MHRGLGEATDKWTRRELELSQRHEELLLRRETLLRGTETYYDRQAARSASFISDFHKASQRNAALLADLQSLLTDMRQQRNSEGNHKFRNLVTNYWTMVRKVYPEWLEEQREYERRHGLPESTLPDPNVITGNMSARGSQQSPRQSPRARSPRSKSPSVGRSPKSSLRR